MTNLSYGDLTINSKVSNNSSGFTYEELFDDVQKAANAEQVGKFVECGVSNIKFNFTKVRKDGHKENKTSSGETAKGAGADEKK